MMHLLGWLQLSFLIVAAAILTGAIISALASTMWFERLRRIAPRSRFVLLGAMGLFPVALGALALSIAFAPSVLDSLGLITDHCAEHGGHAFHLCFLHGTPPPASALVLGGGTVLTLWILAGWSDDFARIRRMNAWRDRLSNIARYDASIDGWTIDSEQPVAAAIGLMRPKVCVSERLRKVLTPEQFEAVMAHERAHVRRRDPLVKFLVRLGALCHFPAVRRRLLSELDLACEQSCDEAAADAVGDRLTVAEALLAVERAFTSEELPVPALGFGAHALEDRVKAMAEPRWRSAGWLSNAALFAGAAYALIVSYDVLHHAAESLLALFF